MFLMYRLSKNSFQYVSISIIDIWAAAVPLLRLPAPVKHGYLTPQWPVELQWFGQGATVCADMAGMDLIAGAETLSKEELLQSIQDS